MKKIQKFLSLAVVSLALAFFASGAIAAEILGKWKTESGETAQISKCGDSFCIVLKTGKYKGQNIGKVKLSGNKYKGTVRDPADDKTYTGSIVVNGNQLKMQGCVAIFCKTQTWTRM